MTTEQALEKARLVWESLHTTATTRGEIDNIAAALLEAQADAFDKAYYRINLANDPELAIVACRNDRDDLRAQAEELRKGSDETP